MGEVVPLGRASDRPADPVRPPLGEVLRLRQERRARWGEEMRCRRLARGLSARDLAAQLGIASGTMVSAVEAGRGRIPEGTLRLWAAALGLEAGAFAWNYLQAFEPELAQLIAQLRAAGGSDGRIG